tara:strand:- start:2443 stop:2814 length:372 start_codon:yes stop_codon:yes gene_type:complete
MANPNIVNVANIYGKTVYDADISGTPSAIVTNAASSGKIYKINSLTIANIDGSNAADFSAQLRNASGGSILSNLAKTISVPADSTLVVVSKDTSLYLEEDMSIWIFASVAGDLSAIMSYDEIS